jgi:hypothetical protein
MDRAILEEIASRLDGTDDSLFDLMKDMGIEGTAWPVEKELEEKLGFGYCQECAIWEDDVHGGLCEVCR